MEIKGFASGSYNAQSPLSDSERCINWIPEDSQSPTATNSASLYPSPGVTQLGDVLPGGGGTGHFFQNGREFAVVGTIFYEINAAGAPTALALVSLTQPDHPATICGNGKAGGQLMITAGNNLFIFDLATNVTTQVVAMQGKATMGDQLDGYFLAIDSSTGTWYFSDLNDGLTWQTGTNFVNRSIASDSWVALKVANRYIWLMGSETSEIWYDAGTFPMPFAPYVSSVIPYGCGAIFSPGVTNGVISWVGRTGDGKAMVLQSQGTNPSVISTYALSNVLNGYSTLADGIGDTYTSRGHTFYMVSFPTAEATHVYDINTQLWHERLTWIEEQNEFIAWRPRYHAFAFDEHRMLDSVTGALYRMSEDIFTDVEERPIRRVRQTPTLFSENEQIFIDALELSAEIGLGNTEQDPLLELYQYAISFWQMEEAVGNRVDQIGLNPLAPNAVPGNAVGIIGNALSLVKASVQSVSITNAAQTGLNPGIDDFSMSFWMYPTTISGAVNYIILRKGNTGAGASSPGYQIALRGTGLSFPGTLLLSFGGPPSLTTGLFCRYQVTPPLNTWSHIVATFDRDGIARIYMNGVEGSPATGFSTLNGLNSQGLTTGDCQPTDDFCIGDTAPAAGQSFDGRIDAVGFFKTVLNQEQVLVLYNGGAGRQMQTADIGTWQANDGSDPQVMMRQSNDGGKTWGIERWRSAGKQGHYSRRIRWNRLGMGRRRVWEISTTDSIPWRLLGAYLDLRQSPRSARASG